MEDVKLLNDVKMHTNVCMRVCVCVVCLCIIGHVELLF